MPVRSALTDSVLTLTLDRPERRNAVDLATVRDLRDRLRAVVEDSSVRCVVLTGAGDAFCAGADVSPDSRSGDDEPLLPVADDAVRLLVSVPVPVVAVVRGPAAGIGMSFALACDLVLAADDAYFLSAFVHLGLLPDGGATHFLPAAMGRARAARTALLGERLPAAEALAAGLVSSVHPAADLAAEAERVTRLLAAGPPHALARTKAALHAGAADLLEAALAREEAEQAALVGAPENVEGAAAFRERRRPVFPTR